MKSFTLLGEAERFVHRPVVVIPARNEGPRVGGMVRRVRRIVAHARVLVVVNGCTDDTEAQAIAAGAEVVTSAPGYARALQAGYRAAVAGWGDGPGSWLVQLDADGQHPPEILQNLVDALDRADLVIGSRFMGGHRPDWMPLHRQVAVALLARWTTVVSGMRVEDVTSGYMALSSEVVRSFAADFPLEVADANVLVRATREGFRILEVPVQMNDRAGGKSMHGGLGSVVYLLRAMERTLQAGRAPSRDG